MQRRVGLPWFLCVVLCAIARPASAQLVSPPARLLPASGSYAPRGYVNRFVFSNSSVASAVAARSSPAMSEIEGPPQVISAAGSSPSGGPSRLVAAATWNRDATVSAAPVQWEGAACDDCQWDWQVLPDGLLFPAYLAGANESRIGITWFEEQDDGWFWDVTLGGHVGILRYGNNDGENPEGVQLDIEGAAFPRLDSEQNLDMVSTDFRFGIPITASIGAWQWKFGYYHLSSHLGDELILRTGRNTRFNYSRDAIVLAAAYKLTDNLRVYAEADYAYEQDVAGPWAFQFGFDYAPAACTGITGAPFVALNGHLREEVDFAGNLTAMAGWAWRGGDGHLLRTGVHYYNGLSPQFSFFDLFEQQIGAGIWYDY